LTREVVRGTPSVTITIGSYAPIALPQYRQS